MLKIITSTLMTALLAGGVLFAESKLPGETALSADVPAPDWAKDLVIYEIATKGFTSPHGPESGTFASLQAKIPYLKTLGINGIWLTGHSLSDSKHFYNIWTQYACIDPFKIDPSLGTPEEFRAMIDACHQASIRVFLDVITHGVVNDSPLIKEHPDWFKAGSWRMTDYRWGSRNPNLDKWWVDGWTEMVRNLGVDGFRLDCGFPLVRYDLWKEIRSRCAALGHPIVVFPEPTQIVAGATDFGQHYMAVSPASKLRLNVAQAIRAAYGGPAQKSHAKGFLGSVQLSCHDHGQEGYPLDKDPYVACGSRYLMGYATLFAPAIPLFMSGEEFDCDFRPLPTLSTHLYGGANPGKGRWLYGSMMDWAQLGEPRHQAMLKDVSRMLAIRRAHAGILSAEDITLTPRIAAVPIEGDSSGLPTPYIRWNGNEAILIAANPTDKPVELRLKLAIATLGWNFQEIAVTDLWNDRPAATRPVPTGIFTLTVKLGPDKTRGGGLAVFLIKGR